MSSEKRFNLQEFEQRNKEYQEKKQRKIAALQEEKDTKDVEHCTFIPNQAPLSHSQISRAKSSSRVENHKSQQRTMQQFLDDQKKKEEERMMKITLKLELS